MFGLIWGSIIEVLKTRRYNDFFIMELNKWVIKGATVSGIFFNILFVLLSHPVAFELLSFEISDFVLDIVIGGIFFP